MFAFDFAERLQENEDFQRYVNSLKGKRLGCHCKPLPCHLDIVVTYLEGERT